MCLDHNARPGGVIRRYWALKVSSGTKFRVIGRYWALLGPWGRGFWRL